MDMILNIDLSKELVKAEKVQKLAVHPIYECKETDRIKSGFSKDTSPLSYDKHNQFQTQCKLPQASNIDNSVLCICITYVFEYSSNKMFLIVVKII